MLGDLYSYIVTQVSFVSVRDERVLRSSILRYLSLCSSETDLSYTLGRLDHFRVRAPDPDSVVRAPAHGNTGPAGSPQALQPLA